MSSELLIYKESHCGGIGSHNTLKMYCFFKRISSSLINDNNNNKIVIYINKYK